MASPGEQEELHVIERVELSDDEDDDFEYTYATIDQHLLTQDEDEDNTGYDDADEGAEEENLASILAKLNERAEQATNAERLATTRGARTTTHMRPSVVDDFIRGFLIRAGMTRSLECFNTEWSQQFELQSKGKLPPELLQPVPDVYIRNQELDEQIRALRNQMDKMQDIANRAQSTWDKFRKERDFHRMHHKRVVQEKEKLVGDVKRLRNHIRSYEPMIAELRRKYEIAMKEKMLISLERDRIKERAKMAQSERSPQSLMGSQQAPEVRPSDTLQKNQQRNQSQSKSKLRPLPADDPAINPFISLDFEPAPIDRFQPKKSFRGHLNSVSAIAFHPRKPVFATASDDLTWKLWSAPECELIMSGEGHTGWLADVDFHPAGTHLSTSSGDDTVKIWDFVNAECAATFVEHTAPVWGCAFHYTGDFVASCSMDHTARLWDITTGQCRQTFRGHVDSVNAVRFQSFTSNVCTASGDKTVSVWDCRSGLCVQTLFGHGNSCNDLCCSVRGDLLVSCDADGVVKVWDIRMVAELCTIDVSQHPINKIYLDRSATRVMTGGDDGIIRGININDRAVVVELRGHDEAVQCVKLDPTDSYLLSGASDCTFRIWG